MKIDREQFIKNCLRKRVYKTESAAYAVIHHKKKEKKLKPYTCPVCGELHIGHIIPRNIRLAQ